MSDLAATNCGCGCDNGCNDGRNGGCMNNSCLWIILLLFCCGNNNGCGCDGDNSCFWIILLLFFCSGCGNNLLGGGCGC